VVSSRNPPGRVKPSWYRRHTRTDDFLPPLARHSSGAPCNHAKSRAATPSLCAQPQAVAALINQSVDSMAPGRLDSFATTSLSSYPRSRLRRIPRPRRPPVSVTEPWRHAAGRVCMALRKRRQASAQPRQFRGFGRGRSQLLGVTAAGQRQAPQAARCRWRSTRLADRSARRRATSRSQVVVTTGRRTAHSVSAELAVGTGVTDWTQSEAGFDAGGQFLPGSNP